MEPATKAKNEARAEGEEGEREGSNEGINDLKLRHKDPPLSLSLTLTVVYDIYTTTR